MSKPAPGRTTPSNNACQVCVHPERGRVESAIANGAAQKATARKFGLSEFSVHRHWKKHVSPERRAQLTIGGSAKLHEIAERAAAENMSLLDYLSITRSTLMAQFLNASEAGDRHGCALIASRLHESLRMIAQLTGELTKVGAQVTNNTLILSSPLMADLQAMLTKRLAPYPEAARAVLEGLEELSARALRGATPALPPLSFR
jgi:hypothetical protein